MLYCFSTAIIGLTAVSHTASRHLCAQPFGYGHRVSQHSLGAMDRAGTVARIGKYL